VDFVVGLGTLPCRHRIALAEGMAKLEVARHRDRSPNVLGRCRDGTAHTHGPFEPLC
jgi:hypothetical protein